jgi:hypothetical protein
MQHMGSVLDTAQGTMLSVGRQQPQGTDNNELSSLLPAPRDTQPAPGAQAAAGQRNGSDPTTNNDNNDDSSSSSPTPAITNEPAGAGAAVGLPVVLPHLQQLQLCDCLVDDLALSAVMRSATGLRGLQLLGELLGLVLESWHAP